MELLIIINDGDRERMLVKALQAGERRCGDHVRRIDRIVPGATVALVGVKSRELFREAIETGGRVVYFDKGVLLRSPMCWRIAIDAQQPNAYIEHAYHDLKRLSVRPHSWRQTAPQKHILLDGASAKLHNFYRIPPPTDYAHGVIKKIRTYSARAIAYRPKWTWREAVPIDGTIWAKEPGKIDGWLRNAHALVTYASSACVDALLFGVPSVILGPGATRSVSSTDLAEIEMPQMADDQTRLQLLANLSYCEWTNDEYAAGSGWRQIRKMLDG